MPSFTNTLRRCYATVRGLIKSCAATSLFVRTLRDAPYYLQLLRRELVESTRVSLPRRLPGGAQLRSRAFLPGAAPSRSKTSSAFRSCLRRSGVQPSQLLAIDEAGASLFEASVAVRVMRQSFLIRRNGIFGSSAISARPRAKSASVHGATIPLPKPAKVSTISCASA
jgi:hypothetical protein